MSKYIKTIFKYFIQKNVVTPIGCNDIQDVVSVQDKNSFAIYVVFIYHCNVQSVKQFSDINKSYKKPNGNINL